MLEDHNVKLIGLGARDSLRLEAGLCLYGHDLDTKTTPVEASLTWALSKKNKEEGNFLGASISFKTKKFIFSYLVEDHLGLNDNRSSHTFGLSYQLF